MESDSLLNRIPSNQQLIDYLLDNPEDHFQTLSLFIPNDILKSAVSMIDAKQVRKVVTVPGNRIYYEFTKPSNQDQLHFCLPHHCECSNYISSVSNNRMVHLCEHIVAIAIIKQNQIDIPTRKVSLQDVLASMK